MRASQASENLSLKAVGVELKAGDAITIKAGGGGGYGDPLSRDPRVVLEDIRQDYVTVKHAAEAYGVVVADGEVDLAATERVRSERRLRTEQ